MSSEERERLTAERSVSPEVYESYVKGRSALDQSNSRREIEDSIAYFEEAIRKDATFAPAYVGLADGYNRLGLVFICCPCVSVFAPTAPPVWDRAGQAGEILCRVRGCKR